MDRLYSVLEVKDLSSEKREFSGVASTIGTDRMGDIVEPRGAQFKLPLPLLWQHNANKPIGHVTSLSINKDSIVMDAKVFKTDTQGGLRDRLEEAWESIKMGLVRGLSIGFRAIDAEPIKDSLGTKFNKWELLEVSSVTIPANMEASIQTIKSMHTSDHKSVRVNGGYKLPEPEPKCYANTDGSFNLRMPGDG